MRRMLPSHKKTIFPCCIKTFCIDDAHVLTLSRMARMPAKVLEYSIKHDRPLGDISSRKIHEATAGVLKAQSVPRDMTATSLYSLPKYQRNEWCCCKRMTIT